MTRSPTTVTRVSIDRVLLEHQNGGRTDHGLVASQIVMVGGHYVRAARNSVATWHLERGSREMHDEASGSLIQHFGPVKRLDLRNCTVVGQGSVVTCGAGLLVESAVEFLARDRSPDGFSMVDGALQIDDATTRFIERPSLLVKRPWFRNYGHWLVDGAALLALDVMDALPDDTQIVVGLCDSPEMRAIVAETLRFIAPGRAIVEHPDHEIWRFAKLHYVTPVHRPPLFKLPAAILNLRAAVLGPLARQAGPPALVHCPERKRSAATLQFLGSPDPQQKMGL